MRLATALWTEKDGIRRFISSRVGGREMKLLICPALVF
jgi:hypothetical protein